MEAKYRIQTEDGRIKYVGTNTHSWMDLETARERVDYDEGERIVEHNGVDILWEIF